MFTHGTMIKLRFNHYFLKSDPDQRVDGWLEPEGKMDMDEDRILILLTKFRLSRPQKKATSHHMKTRPCKTQPWDIKHRPIVYAPLPPLPPEWTVVSSYADASDVAVPPPTPQPATE